MGEYTRPTELSIQAEAVKRLSVRMIFSLAGLARKPGSASKATDGKRDAINNQLIADYLVTQPTPQTLFDDPQIGGLPDKGCAMDTSHCWEKVGVVTSKVLVECLILAQAKIAARHFQGDHFTVTQLGLLAVLAHLLSSYDLRQYLVNQEKNM